MAKKPKTTGNHNKDLLIAIASATAANSFMYVTKDECLPLLTNQPPLIEVNTEMLDPNDANKAAARITQAGTNYLRGLNVNTTAPVTASSFAIMSNIPVPASKKGNFKGSGAPAKYPFDGLEVGQSFFVPASEKVPDPTKTLGSSVSAAQMKYATATGQTKEVERSKRGAGGKAELDAAGNKVMEKKMVPVYKFERKFVIRSIKKGDVLGTWTAENDGALIARVAVE